MKKRIIITLLTEDVSEVEALTAVFSVVSHEPDFSGAWQFKNGMCVSNEPSEKLKSKKYYVWKSE